MLAINHDITKRDKTCTLCKLSKECSGRVCDLIERQLKNEVMVIAEMPSARADRGLAAKLLAEFGINAFHASAVNCEPQKGKKPTDAQIRSCRHYLMQQIKNSGARFVLLMGNAALYAIKDCKGINKERGRPFTQDGVIYLPTWTPNTIYHNPEAATTIRRDLKLFADIIAEGEVPHEKALKYTIVDTKRALMSMLKRLTGSVAFDIETTGLFPWAASARVTTIQFAVRGRQYVVPIQHRDSPWFSPKQIVRIINKRFLRNPPKFVTHNGKFDYLWMKVVFGVNWQKFAYFDTMIAHYLLDENNLHGLKHLATTILGAPDWDVDKTVKIDGPLPELAFYGAHDVYYTLKLKNVLLRRLKREPSVHRVFKWIMMPIVQRFVDIEFNGVTVDIENFHKAEIELKRRIREAKKELRKYGNINWGSTTQLRDFLFVKMKLKPLEITKTGQPSTAKTVLKRMDHPVIGALLRFRAAKQQLSFFIDGWGPYLDGNTLHPSFKLHGTVTGRLSCENPNLQQVPRDGFIRNLLIAPDGWEFIEADLSQIELRIAAELANAKSLIKVFRTGGDAHWLTALTEISRGRGKKKEVLATGKALAGGKVSYNRAIKLMLKAGPDRCIEIEPAWKELRKKAKAVNFGYLYGMWWKKFKIYARDNYGVNVTDEQAQDSRIGFFELYPELTSWHNRQKRLSAVQGYVTSLSGRRRRLPAAMMSEDTPSRREAQRQAINSPVQSFANELNLMVAIQLTEEYGTDIVRLCGTVHDAIIFIVKREHVEEVYGRVLEIMRAPRLLKKFGIKMKVPIEGEAKIGPWGKGVSLDKWLSQSTSRVSTLSSRRPTASKASSRSSGSYAMAA